VVLHALTAHTGGLLAELHMHWRGPVAREDLMRVLHDETSDGLRLGFGYGAPNETALHIPGRGDWADGEPRWHVGSAGGGGGGDDGSARYDAAFKLAPYPASGMLTIAVSWPKHDIEESMTIIELPSHSDVSARTHVLWP
jgi:hypothetical protein